MATESSLTNRPRGAAAQDLPVMATASSLSTSREGGRSWDPGSSTRTVVRVACTCRLAVSISSRQSSGRQQLHRSLLHVPGLYIGKSDRQPCSAAANSRSLQLHVGQQQPLPYQQSCSWQSRHHSHFRQTLLQNQQSAPLLPDPHAESAVSTSAANFPTQLQQSHLCSQTPNAGWPRSKQAG